MGTHGRLALGTLAIGTAFAVGISCTSDAHHPSTVGSSTILSAVPDAGTYEAESDVALSSDGTVAVVWIAEAPGMATIGCRFSPDRGATWRPIQNIREPNGGYVGDPVVAAAPNGDFFLAGLGQPDPSVNAHTILVGCRSRLAGA